MCSPALRRSVLLQRSPVLTVRSETAWWSRTRDHPENSAAPDAAAFGSHRSRLPSHTYPQGKWPASPPQRGANCCPCAPTSPWLCARLQGVSPSAIKKLRLQGPVRPSLSPQPLLPFSRVQSCQVSTRWHQQHVFLAAWSPGSWCPRGTLDPSCAPPPAASPGSVPEQAAPLGLPGPLHCGLGRHCSRLTSLVGLLLLAALPDSSGGWQQPRQLLGRGLGTAEQEQPGQPTCWCPAAPSPEPQDNGWASSHVLVP